MNPGAMSSRVIESSIEKSSATASDSKESSNWGTTTPLSLPPYKWWERIRLHVEALFKAFTLLDRQHQLKQIAASQHVLKTYHDSFLFGKVPLSVKLRALLRTGTVSLVWHIMEGLLAILSGAVYIYTTYHFHEEYEWVTLTQDTVSCLFLMDYVLRVYSEPVRLQYMFSYIGVLDFLSATPIIFLYQHKNPVGGAAVLHLLQFSRFIRILTFPTSVGIVASTVIEQILLLVVSCFGAVFLDAGIVQWIEYAAASEQIQQNCPTSGCINFMDAFYYVVATISTVGYGDVTTKTNAGKIVSIVTIMCALVFIPYQVARITRLASSRPYGGTFNARKIIGNRYLIISGSVSFQAVQICLAEFYNPTHCDDIKAYPLHVNILAPFIPSFEFKKMLSLYNGHVEFMEGSPVHQSDLERVCASHAAAIFLLANKQTNDTKVEDAAQIVRALAVNRHCGNKVRIIVEVLEPATQTCAVWDETESGAIEVICPAKIHYKMLSRSCVVRGLYTLITNLFTSEIKLKELPRDHFISEYFHSFDNEVYPVIFPIVFHNMLFEEVAAFVYRTFNAVLFALDVTVLHKDKDHHVQKVLLHPKGHIINPYDVGLVIASDLRTAYSISNYRDKQQQLSFIEKVMNTKHESQYMHSAVEREAESVIRRLRRTGSYTVGTFNRDLHKDENGVEKSKVHTFPVSAEGHYKLESKLRSAIYHANNVCQIEAGRRALSNSVNKHDGGYDMSSSTSMKSDDASSGLHLTSCTLEQATEDLLAWPPLLDHGHPHPAVLERRADVILEDLRQRTVSVVQLDEPHILVCCQRNWPHHIYYFIKGLRNPLSPTPPIVILYPGQPSAEQWGLVGVFTDIYFIKGSPIYELDLMRGGVLHAEKVVILGDQGTPVDLHRQDVQDLRNATRMSVYTSDVDNILVAANVERLVGEKQEILLVEMHDTIGFFYLRPQFEISQSQVRATDYKRNRNAIVHLGPTFMGGKAVCAIFLGFLMRSSFFNRNTVSIVEQMVEGGCVEHDGCLGDDHSRLLQQIEVPIQYVNHHFCDLFTGLLLEKGILSLGIYRACGTLGSPTAYVLTNPLKETIINAGDLVYVLC